MSDPPSELALHEQRCTFCRAPRAEVRTLITGPGVSICDACTQLGIQIMLEETAEPVPHDAALPPRRGRAGCFQDRSGSVYGGMAIEVGTRAGKYELVQQLGAGGFGMVFLARDHELGRDCALKFLLPEHTGNAEHVQRFLQEARAAAQIHHPGIVTVFECGQFPRTGSGVDGLVYIAMELLRGESLADRLSRGALPVADAVAIARQIASAVGAAHQIGIVHRDLKPENVYLVPDPETVSGKRVKVLDFGIAKLGEASAASAVQTATYVILGSPRYMSPEQCRSTARVDTRADIYSLGVMLFELLCGERPFVDSDMGGMIANHLVVEPPRLCTKVVGLPAELDELVASMLAKSPAARPQSMEAVQRALEPFRASTVHAGPRRAASEEAAASVATERAASVATERAAVVVTEHVMTRAASSPGTPPAGAPTPPAGAPPAPPVASPMVTPMRLPAAGSPPDRPGPLPPPERTVRRRSSALRWVVGGGLAAVAAVTAVVLATRSPDPAPAPRAAAPPAGSPQRLPTPQELRDHHRATIARRDAATFGAALTPAVFALGPNATELAHGPSATRALIDRHIDRIPIGPRDAPIGHADDVAWWLEIGGDRPHASSTIAVAAGPEWRIAAWKLAHLVPNLLAARLATANKLPVPAELVWGPDPAPAAPAVEAAFRAAMSSRAAFVAAFSTRGDAIATGTAPGELMIGGKVVRATFSRLKSELSLRGALATGRITDRAAWAATNIDYAMTGHTTQIYRVLALMLKEGERWTIVLAHFSNAGPIVKP